MEEVDGLAVDVVTAVSGDGRVSLQVAKFAKHESAFDLSDLCRACRSRRPADAMYASRGSDSDPLFVNRGGAATLHHKPTRLCRSGGARFSEPVEDCGGSHRPRHRDRRDKRDGRDERRGDQVPQANHTATVRDVRDVRCLSSTRNWRVTSTRPCEGRCTSSASSPLRRSPVSNRGRDDKPTSRASSSSLDSARPLHPPTGADRTTSPNAGSE